MSGKPKSLVDRFIRDSKGRQRLISATGVLAVFTILVTVGILTFPAISISGSDEELQEQGIYLNVGESSEAAVPPPADEDPQIALDAESAAPAAEGEGEVATAITEDTYIGDETQTTEPGATQQVVDPTTEEAATQEATDAPVAEVVEGEAVVINEEGTEAPAVEPVVEEEVVVVQERELTEEEVAAAEAADAAKHAAEEVQEITYSEAAAAALATADISSQRLIIGSSNAEAFAEDANVVASFDNIYLLQFDSIEATAEGFLRYFDIADYVTPDVALEVADEVVDPNEAIITTENVYTEEANPFSELETALVEETTAEADAAAESNEVALVAVIDTGAAVSENVVEAVSMLGADPADDNGHGQRMVDYVIEENEAAQVLSIKALGADGKGDVSAVVAGINYAIERGASIINLSASAYASEENAALAEAVKRAEEAGVTVVGAAGNNGFNARFYIPGNIAEATIVGASDDQGVRIKQSNFGETVDYNFWAGSTSEAAARMSGFISANGEDGVAAVLNQGRIFSTDYVAVPAEEPVEGEEPTEGEGKEPVDGEGTAEGETKEPVEGEEVADGKGEETPDEANQDTDITAQANTDVTRAVSEVMRKEKDRIDNANNPDYEDKYPPAKNQASRVEERWQKEQITISSDGKTARVATWDALAVAAANNNIETIILDKGVFAAVSPGDTSGDRVPVLAAYFTIEINHDVTIKGDTITEIYHDAEPDTSAERAMTSYFKVKEGKTLTLDGVTLTGKSAYTAHSDVSKSGMGRVALEQAARGYEVRLYDKDDNTPYYLDALKTTENGGKLIKGTSGNNGETIQSVIAVAPGTLSDPPVPGEPFAIREKNPQANGNYRFLVSQAGGTGQLVLVEVNPDNVLNTFCTTTTVTDPETETTSTIVTGYNQRFIWNIAETPASFLYNSNGSKGFVVVHDGYFDAAAWKDNPPLLPKPTTGFRVQPTNVPYTVSSTTHGYFVDIESGGTLTLTNSAKIEYANGGNAAIKSDGGNINIYDGVEISNNKSSDSVYSTTHHWAGGRDRYPSDARKNDAPSAGAINMVGGELNIVCTDPSKGISIHDNRGAAANTAGAIRISGTQAQVLGNVAIYDNRARKNDKYSAVADLAEMRTWVGSDGLVDRTKVQTARRDMHLNGVGTGSYIVNLAMYNANDPVTGAKMEILVTAWESAGAILAEDGARLTIGSETEKTNTPQIYGNTGEAGAIRITGSNTVVDQYYATIGGKPENPNYGTNGGAVHVSEGTYNMHTGEMSWNGAWGKGGAVAVSLDGTFNLGDADGYNGTLDAPEIAHNLATFNGGGVYIESNNVNLYYGDIYDNLAGMYGGGVYVTGDSLSTTYNLRFPDPVDEDIANAYVYENDAYRIINNNSNPYGEYGDGGGMWSCPWGSYLYKEDRLAIFANRADRNGDDFTKQGSSDNGQGMGAAFEPVPGHVWRYDHAGTARHGQVLYPEYVFPTFEYMNLKSDLTMQQVSIPTAKQAVLIHGNKASDGAGIGSNGIITFEDLPEYYKVISAKLKLDKKWNDTIANHDGRKVKLDIRILDASGNPVKLITSAGTEKERDPYTVTLDGATSGEKLADETATGKIKWNKWQTTIDLPTYTFSIKNLLRQALVDSGLSTDEANAVLENTSDLSQIDQLQERLGSTNADPKRYAYVIDYLKAKVEGGTAPNVSASDEFAATVAFDGWQLEIKETILKSDGTVEENPPYNLDFGKLYFSKKNSDALYSSKFVDTGRNFIVYTDEYELSTALTNWNRAIKINKVDQDGEDLSGAAFELYKKGEDGTYSKYEDLTSENSLFTTSGLTKGDYYIVESLEPTGYEGYGNRIYFSIDEQNAVTTYKNGEIYVGNDGKLRVGGQQLYVDEVKEGGSVVSTTGGTPLILTDIMQTPIKESDLRDGTSYWIHPEGKSGFFVQARKQDANQSDGYDKTRMTTSDQNTKYDRYKWRYNAATKTLTNVSTTYGGTICLINNEPRLTFDLDSVNPVEFDNDTFTFTVTNTWEETKVKVNKVWSDTGSHDPITVTLYSDIESAGNFSKVNDENNNARTLTLSSANNWTGIFENLQRHVPDTSVESGKRVIRYVVAEDPVPEGYFESYDYKDPVVGDDGAVTWEITVTNTKKSEDGVTATVEKTWEGVPEADYATKLIQVHLTSDYAKEGEFVKVEGSDVTLSAANNWTHTWYNQEKYSADKKRIVKYKAVETVPAGYTETYSASSVAINPPSTAGQYFYGYSATNSAASSQAIGHSRYYINHYNEQYVEGHYEYYTRGGYRYKRWVEGTTPDIVKNEIAYCMHYNRGNPLSTSPGSEFLRTETSASDLNSRYANYQANGDQPYFGHADGARLYNVLRMIAFYGAGNDAAGIQKKYGLSEAQFVYLTQFAMWEYTDFFGGNYVKNGKKVGKKSNGDYEYYAYGLTAPGTDPYGYVIQIQDQGSVKMREAYKELLRLVDTTDANELNVISGMKLYIYYSKDYPNYYQCLLGVETAGIKWQLGIKNTRIKGEVVVTKDTAENFSDANQSFYFTMLIPTGKVLDSDIQAAKWVKNGTENKLEFETVTIGGTSYLKSKLFNLKKGESVTLKSFPVGIPYAICEVTESGNGVDWIVKAKNQVGVIGASASGNAVAAVDQNAAVALFSGLTSTATGTTSTVEFKNYKPQVELQKVGLDGAITGEAAQAGEFKITPLTVKNAQTKTYTANTSAAQTISLNAEGKFVTVVDSCGYYLVEETAAPTGFFTPSFDWIATVTFDDATNKATTTLQKAVPTQASEADLIIEGGKSYKLSAVTSDSGVTASNQMLNIKQYELTLAKGSAATTAFAAAVEQGLNAIIAENSALANGLKLNDARFTFKDDTPTTHAYYSQHDMSKPWFTTNGWSNNSGELVTNGNGIVETTITNILPGEYIISETKSPSGYESINGSVSWRISVDKDGNIALMSGGNGKDEYIAINTANKIVGIENVPVTVKLPATGGIGTHVFVIAGVLIMLVAGALFVRRSGRSKE